MNKSTATNMLSIVAPLLFIVIILTADTIEGPKTAYVGVLAVVPMFAAVFGTVWTTAIISAVTVLSAWTFGHFASDGNVQAQTVRLVIISIVGLLAIYAVRVRMKRESDLVAALQEAAFAAQMKVLADTDQLTELLNRRGLLSRLENEAVQDRCLVIIDIDNLKKVNDEFGHLVGDSYIKAIAGRLAGSLSKTDFLGRWGGDEFLIVINSSASGAEGILTRLQHAVTRADITTDNLRISASFSAGAALWLPGEPLDDALRRADGALYSAKSQGRNTVVFANSL